MAAKKPTTKAVVKPTAVVKKEAKPTAVVKKEVKPTAVIKPEVKPTAVVKKEVKPTAVIKPEDYPIITEKDGWITTTYDTYSVRTAKPETEDRKTQHTK
tara:strand:+ start:26 stop:322 length:297 start_codon:yes stop_codon:yes gene_type:complete